MWTDVFEKMDQQHGGVKGYLKGLGFSENDIVTMRKNLATPPASSS